MPNSLARSLHFLQTAFLTTNSLVILTGIFAVHCAALQTSALTYSHLEFRQSPVTVQEQETNKETDPLIAALISQLGDADYSTRTQAETKLLSMGGKAIEPLRLAITHRETDAPDSEIRLRCTRLLILIERKEAERKIQSFLAGSSNSDSMPGWSKFSSISGDDKNSRKLFASIHQAHPELFDAIAKSKTETENVIQGIAKSGLYRSSANETLATAVAIMFASTLEFDSQTKNQPEKVQIGITDHQRLQAVITRQQMLGYLKSSGNKTQFDRLISKWIDTIPDTQTTHANLKLVVIAAYGLTEKIDLAMSFATNKELAVRTRTQAIEVVSEIGKQNQVPMLEKIFDDQTLVGNFILRAENEDEEPETEQPNTGNLKAQLMEVQMRDLALAAAIKLSGKETTTFGFHPTSIENDKLKHNRAGFYDEKLRLSAFEAWNASKRSK